MALDRDSGILVTGGGGLLGSALREALDRGGFTHVSAPRRDELDLRSIEAVDRYLDRVQPVCVIHLASVVFGLLGNMRNQFRSLADNTTINSNIFAALHKTKGLERVFFAGTVASYPYPYKALPLAEDQFFEGLPHSGEFGYASAKRHAYSYLRLLQEERGVAFTYGIFTNLYGERDRFDLVGGHVIPSLVAKTHTAKVSGTPLSVWGNGEAVRDFLYVGDAANAIVHCLDAEVQGHVNISSGKGTSIGEVATILAKHAGVDTVAFQSEMPVGIPQRVVSNARLAGTGFNPMVSMADGLAKTYNWYAENIDRVRQ